MRLRAILFMTALLVPASPVVASPAPAENAELFISRVATFGYEKARVFVGGLPAEWTPPVPLPSDVTILGSVDYGATRGVMVYYAPSDLKLAYAVYIAALEAAGFSPAPGVGPTSGQVFANVASELPAYALFCKGLQPVNVIVGNLSSDDLRVSISPAKPVLNTCAEKPGRISYPRSPLPALYTPRATTVSSSGGGSSTNPGPSGTSQTVHSAAQIFGKTSARELLEGYIVQMRSAGWSLTSQSSSVDAAAASFSFEGENARWRAMIAVLRLQEPSKFQAIVEANGTPIPKTAFPLAALPSIPRTLKKSDIPRLVQLTQLVAAGIGGRQDVAVFVGKAPPEIDRAVPLPKGQLIGSTSSRPAPGFESDPPGSDTIYYTLTSQQLRAYLTELKNTGWFQWSPLPPQTGFVGSSGTISAVSYCKPNQPTLRVAARRESSSVAVTVSRVLATGDCPPAQLAIYSDSEPAPLPALTLPWPSKPAWLSRGRTLQGSGTTFETAQPLAAVLDLLVEQMAKAGWATTARTSEGSAVGASFTYGGLPGKNWNAVLTLYRTPGGVTTHAFVNATRSE